MALPQLYPCLPATLWGNRGNPVSPAKTRPGPEFIALTARKRLEEVIGMERLVAGAVDALTDAPAEDVIKWATDTFGDRICITSSMTDAVLIHLASRVRPGIDVIFLDTGYHFAETIGTRDAVSAVYPVNVINVTPSRTVEEQDAKVVPRERALDPYEAWLTGVRTEETSARSDTRVVEWDPRRQMVKVNPIVGWTQEQVDGYIAEHGVLINPLVYDGYPSIGCSTCPARVEPGADPRSGRWEGTGKTECGIHG